MTEPLIVEAEDENAESANLEGAGIFSSFNDLHVLEYEKEPDGDQIAFAAADAGLDALDAAMDPLGALTSAGLGWLIEHVWFLHEPLDALAGDPAQITAQARTWHEAAVALRDVAGQYRKEADGLTGWDGAAAAAYRLVVHDYTAAMEAGAASAEQLGQIVLGSGAAVGTVRSLVRDAIADFVARVVIWAVGAAVTAWLTAGGSLAALAVQVTVDAAGLAAKIAGRISRLLDELAAAGDDVVEVAATLKGLAADLRRLVPPAQPAFDVTPAVPELVETGKQLAEAEQEQREWTR